MSSQPHQKIMKNKGRFYIPDILFTLWFSLRVMSGSWYHIIIKAIFCNWKIHILEIQQRTQKDKYNKINKFDYNW